MSGLQVYNQQKTLSLSSLSPMHLLKIARPSTKCKFVRQGDTVHLVVFLNDFSEVPFLRVPADSLYRAVRSFMIYEEKTRLH